MAEVRQCDLAMPYPRYADLFGWVIRWYRPAGSATGYRYANPPDSGRRIRNGEGEYASIACLPSGKSSAKARCAYGYGSFKKGRNIRASSFVIGRPPQERMKASTSSSVIGRFAGFRYTGLTSTLLAALVFAEELEVVFVILLEVEDAMVENLVVS